MIMFSLISWNRACLLVCWTSKQKKRHHVQNKTFIGWMMKTTLNFFQEMTSTRGVYIMIMSKRTETKCPQSFQRYFIGALSWNNKGRTMMRPELSLLWQPIHDNITDNSLYSS